MSSKRVSISLDKREFHTIEAIKYRQVHSDKYFPYIPETKEILQATIYFTRLTISKNKNSLRSFINSISTRRFSPILTEEELKEESEEDTKRYDYEDNPDTYKSQEQTSTDIKTKSYIFTIEDEDGKNLSEIRKKMKRYAKLNVDDVKDGELIKESFNFIIGHKWRNIELFHYIYFGALYDLKPVTSIKLFKKQFSDLTKEELEDIEYVQKDRSVFDIYRKNVSEKQFPISFDSVLEFFPKEATSESGGGFNYGSALLGFWMMSKMLPYNITTFTLSSMMALTAMYDQKYQEKERERWKQQKGLFFNILDELITASENLARNPNSS